MASSLSDFVYKQAMENGSWSDLEQTHQYCLKAKGTLRCVWKFNYNLQIEHDGTRYLMRELVDTPEFRERLASALAIPYLIATEVSPLEKYQNNAYLYVAFDQIVRDGPCEDCGAAVENGRMTCLCWADEEDIARMNRDAALHR